MTASLLEPRWLVGHVLVVIVSTVFIVLGFWQLDRHHDQRLENEVIEARIAADPVELTRETAAEPANQLRQAVVRGEYRYSDLLELRPRARDGRLGYEQIVPLATADGVVLINRGFIADSAGAVPEQGAIRVELIGTIRESQGTSRFGPQNPDAGTLTTIARIDIERLSDQFGRGLYPIYLDLVSEDPAAGPSTVLPAPPEPTTRPHLLYSIQWWSFAAISSVGWIVYLRKQFGHR